MPRNWERNTLLVNPVMCGCIEKDTPAGTCLWWTLWSCSVDALSSQCHVLWSSPTTSYRLNWLAVPSFQLAGRWILVYYWLSSYFVKIRGSGKDHAATTPVITRKERLWYSEREAKMADKQSTATCQGACAHWTRRRCNPTTSGVYITSHYTRITMILSRTVWDLFCARMNVKRSDQPFNILFHGWCSSTKFYKHQSWTRRGIETGTSYLL